MKQFALGSLVGFAVGVSIAATPAQEKNPCEGWKIDCLALEAAVLMAANSDYDKYQNIRDNIGIVMSNILGGGLYQWETDKLPKSEQMINDKIREAIVRESIEHAKKILEERTREEPIKLDA